MAMEFATTGLMRCIGSDDSWLLRAPGVFCLWASEAGRNGDFLRLTLIAVFGAIGTLTRYGLQGVVQVRAGGGFPYGTLLINLTGCFLLGLIGQFTLNRLVISPDWRVAIAVGFFGGYTTFSSFGWETAKMLEDGEWARAGSYVAASVVVGILLSFAGIRLANRL
jgi:fluoride exporter